MGPADQKWPAAADNVVVRGSRPIASPMVENLASLAFEF